MTHNLAEPFVDLPEDRQFRLRTFFTVATGVAILFGLGSWRPAGGTMLAILVVAPWWTWIGYQGRKGTLAYLLAALTIGAVLSIIPMACVSEVWNDRTPATGELLFLAICVYGFPVLAASLVRPVARKVGRDSPMVVGLAFLWIMVFLFTLSTRFLHPGSVGDLPASIQGAAVAMKLLIESVLVSSTVVIVTSPATLLFWGPLGRLLWRLDARSLRWTATDLAMLETVRQLWAEGAESVHVIHVAERLGYRQGEVCKRLERLFSAGRLTWTFERGYERTD